LHEHLGEFHSEQGRVQVSVCADYIDHGVHKLHRFLQELPLVKSQVHAQRFPVEVALQKQV